jgi:predicted phosphodiesterase
MLFPILNSKFMSDLKLCIISDLHCHSQIIDGKGNIIRDSYLVIDDPNKIKSQNPLESFKEFIISLKEKIDYIIIPGDITNKADEVALKWGWEEILKLKSIIGCKEIIVTIGNHDIDSRKTKYSNPIDLPRSLTNYFPFNDNDLVSYFWENGFVIRDFIDSRFLVLNTSINHVDSSSSIHGHVSLYQLDQIKSKLEALRSDPKQYNIAVCHHHPISHDRFGSPTFDLIENGRNLIELLEEFNFNICIHGHKHDALISYSPSGSNSIPIFASGSFAAYKSNLIAGALNSFHLLTLSESRTENCLNQGIINTYSFVPGKGWLSYDNIYFPQNVGFGCRIPIADLLLRIHKWIEHTGKRDFFWSELISAFPMISFLTPNDLVLFQKKCKENGIHLDPTYPVTPRNCSKKEL